MRQIIDIHMNRPTVASSDKIQIRNFLILTKAYAIGAFSTDATVEELFNVAKTMDENTLADMVTAICSEVDNAKHVI